jgi:hypothetical protein
VTAVGGSARWAKEDTGSNIRTEEKREVWRIVEEFGEAHEKKRREGARERKPDFQTTP